MNKNMTSTSIHPIFKNLVTYSTLSFVQPALSLILLPIYIQYLSPEDYGRLALYAIAASVFSVVANLKLDQAMRTFYFDFNTDKDVLKDYLYSTLSLSMIVALSMLTLTYFYGSTIFSWIFSSADLSFFPLGFIAFLSAACTQCSSSYFVYLQNDLKLFEFAALRVLGIALSVTTQVILVVYLNMGVKGILLGILASSGVVLIVVIARNPYAFVRIPNLALILPALKFSAPFLLLGLLIALERQLDKLVIERFLNLEHVGIYAFTMTIVGACALVFNAVDNSIRPYLYVILKQPGGTQKTNHFITLYLVIGLITFAAIAGLANLLLLLNSNPRFAEIQPLIVPAIIALIPTCFTRYYALHYMFQKKSASLTFWTLLKALFTFAMLLALVPEFGLAGALAAVFLGNMLNMLLLTFHLRLYVGQTFEKVKILCLLAAFILCIYVVPLLLNIVDHTTLGLMHISLFPFLCFLFYKPQFLSLITKKANKSDTLSGQN